MTVKSYDEMLKDALDLYPNIDISARRELGISGFDLLSKQMQQESAGNRHAVSGAGAMGLMQLMPGTAAELGVTDPFDPEQNIHAGVKYLSKQLDSQGVLPLALAAYNAGPGNVTKHQGIPPFKETLNYVKKIYGSVPTPDEILALRQRVSYAALPEEAKAQLEAEASDRVEVEQQFRANASALKILYAEGSLPEGTSELVLPDSFFTRGGVAGLPTDELRGYVEHTDQVIYHGAMNRQVAKQADELGYIGQSSRQLYRSLVSTVLAAKGMTQSALGGIGMVAQAEAEKRVFDLQEERTKLMSKFGMPTDPELQEKYFQNFGLAAILTGELASFALLSAMLPNPAALLGRVAGGGKLATGLTRLSPFMKARAASIAAGQGRGRILSLMSAVSRVPMKGVGTARGTALAGIGGGGLGFVTSLTLDPDADTVDHARAAIAGAAGGILAWTALMGRPVGVLAREAFHKEAAGELGRWGSLTTAMRLSPRTTIGHLTGAGTLGAVFGVSQAYEQGEPGLKAAYAGAVMGGEWMFADVVLARLGGLARWTKARTQFSENLTTFFKSNFALGAETAANLGGVSQLAARGAMTAAPGAAVGAAADTEDPVRGALMGAAASGIIGTAALYMGAPSVVPKALLRKLANGGLELSKDESTFLAKWGIYQAARKTAAETADPVISEVIRGAAGRLGEVKPIGTSAGLVQVNAQIHMLQMEYLQLTGGIELFPDTPEGMSRLAEVAGKILHLRERRSQLLANIGSRIKELGDDAVLTDEARVAIRGVPARIAASENIKKLTDRIGWLERQIKIQSHNISRKEGYFKELDTLQTRLERALLQDRAKGQVLSDRLLRTARERSAFADSYEKLRGVHQARTLEGRAKQSALDAKLAGEKAALEKSAREAQLRGELETQEALRAAGDRLAVQQMKSRLTEEAWANLGEQTPKSIWDELKVALGFKSVLDAKRFVGHDLEQGRYLLARMRAEARDAGMKLETPILLRTSTKEVQQEADRIFSVLDYVEGVIAGGDGALTKDLDEVAQRLGATISTVRHNGIPKTMMDIPGLGLFMDSWKMGLLHQVRDALKQIRPDLLLAATGVVLGATSMSEASMRVEGAFIDFEEDGRDRWSWVPSAVGAAALLAAGIVVNKGLPVTGKGFSKKLAGLLESAQTTMSGKRKNANRVGRELLFMLMEDGEAAVVRGEGSRVPATLIEKARKGRSILFSVHNHPEPGKMLTPDFRRKISLVSEFPSPADISHAITVAPVGERVSFMVLAPNGTFTLVELPGAVSSGTRGAHAGAARIAIQSELDRFGLSKASGATERLYRYMTTHSDAQIEREFTQIFDSYGIRITRGLGPDDLEAAVLRAQGRTNPKATGTIDSIESSAVERMTQSGPGGIQGVEAVLDKKTRDALEEVLFEGGADTSRRMARAGATQVKKVLPSSITAQGVTSNGYSFTRLKQYLESKGYTVALERAQGETRYIIRDPNGRIVSHQNSLSAVVQDTAARTPKNPSGLDLLGTRGYTYGSFVSKAGSGIGIALGATMGSQLESYLRDDPDSTVGGLAAGAFAGYLAGALLLSKGLGFKLRPSSEALLKFFKPEITTPLSEASVRSKIGKTGVAKHEFLSWSESAQTAHLMKRLTRIARKTSYRKQVTLVEEDTSTTIKEMIALEGDALKRARLDEFSKEMRKFTPNTLSGTNYDRLQKVFLGLAKDLEIDPTDAAIMWRGMIGNMTLSFKRRAFPSSMKFWELARRVPNITDDELRDRVLTAEIISGGKPPTPVRASTAAQRAFAQSLTPEASHLKEAVRVSQERDVAFRDFEGAAETGGRLGIPFLAKLLPTEHFRSIGEKLLARGADGDAVGADIIRLHDALKFVSRDTRRDFEGAYERLHQSFAGFNRDQRLLTRRILENPESAETLATKRENPELWRAAQEFKGLLEEYARKIFPEDFDTSGMKIEDYFPWFYSQKTLRQLREDGFKNIGESYLIPIGSGIPEYKMMKNLLRRSMDSPLGEIIEDPLEAGAIYLNGAVRKIHLDKVAAEFDGDFFKRLAESQPIVAGDMARWYLEVFGIPSDQYLRAYGFLQKVGLQLEQVSAMGFNTSDFGQKVIEKYFTSRDSVHQFTRFARGFEFYSKLGWSWISAMVNATQLFVNTGTDVGYNHLFMGGIPSLASTGRGWVAEKIPHLAPFLDPQGKGIAKLNMAREIGVFSDNAKRVLDDLAQREWLENPSKRFLMAGTTMGAVGAGALAGTIIPEDSDATTTLGGAVVAGGSMATAAFLAPSLVRRGLSSAKNAIIAPFQMVEAINRGVTAGAAERQIIHARLARPGGSRVGETVEATALGATLGAATGFAFNEEDRGRGALAGAAVGAVLGGASGLVGETRTSRVQRMIAQQEEGTIVPALRKALREEGVPTEQEINQWYIRQVLDMTQFRFGREARGEWLRTPTGEVLGALQTFTLNQMEFTGARWDAFHHSVAQFHGLTGGGAGKLDTRFWRHLMLVIGTGSAMTSLTLALGNERDPEYWISRIGLGMVPLMSYNEDARRWNLTDLGSHLTGPFVNDIAAGASTVLRLWTDPEAVEAWDEQWDTLARQYFSALRQLEATPEVVGIGLEKLGMESMSELVRAQEDFFYGLGNPATTTRQGQ